MKSAQDIDHKNVALLMPWYVNGTLSKEESEQVAGHIRTCSHCAHDFKATSRMWSIFEEDKNIYPFPKESLDNMLCRIDAYEDAENASTAFIKMQEDNKDKRFSLRSVAAVSLLFLFLASSSLVYLYQVTAPEYVVLSNGSLAETQSIQVKIIFNAAITDLEIHDLLNEINGSIAKSVLDDRSYIVSIPVERGDFDSLLASLTMLTNHEHVEHVELEAGNDDSR